MLSLKVGRNPCNVIVRLLERYVTREASDDVRAGIVVAGGKLPRRIESGIQRAGGVSAVALPEGNSNWGGMTPIIV